MKSVSRFLRSRAALLIFVTAALGSSLGLLPPAPEAQSACAFRPRVTTYYSDATHTTVVGQSGVDCSCNDFSWGVVTPFHTSMQLCCPVLTC
jgi:hypothetical protein